MTFDPFDLSMDVDPEGIELSLSNACYSDAVMMSFKLNETELIARSMEAVPYDDSKYSRTPKIRTPKLRAPPSTGQLR